MTVATPFQDEPTRLKHHGSCCLTRQVSHETLPCADPSEKLLQASGRDSPYASDCDKNSSALSSTSSSCAPASVLWDSFGSHLCHQNVLKRHKDALRLEAELHPLRQILARLMAHPTHNRRGIFNSPVDAKSLGLVDYFDVIKRPMDFGTIKSRLHAIAYRSQQDVVDDIRLVFANAMSYNPPTNTVHICARALLLFFEDQLDAFLPELKAASSLSLPQTPWPMTSSCDSMAQQSFSTLPLNGEVKSMAENFSPSVLTTARRRRKRGSKRNPAHSCQFCKGMQCGICEQGCLPLEPTLLICNGPHCSGTKIRKAAVYFVAPDGSRQYCERCYTGLPAVLSPCDSKDECCRYKRDLLKRKNDEEIVEKWVLCVECGSGVHEICAMHNSFIPEDSEDIYRCPSCRSKNQPSPVNSMDDGECLWTFITGRDEPTLMPAIGLQRPKFVAEDLEETYVSQYIQSNIQELMRNSSCTDSDKTVLVRVISDCNRSFTVPEVVRKHFCMARINSGGAFPLPKQVSYRSKAIMLFQKFDAMDVCIFCMYVHEYDGEKVTTGAAESFSADKRVYIAYLDSIEHFRPRECRTAVFQEILISYLGTARERGFASAHIWACPPTRGNSFVFWNHPSSQRTPSQERLVSWYNETLSRAIERGIVADVKSLYEICFEPFLEDMGHQDCGIYKNKGTMISPPLLDGDFWIEEAVRIHETHFARHLKCKLPDGRISGCDFVETGNGPTRSAFVEIAKLLRDKIISHPDSVLFRRPVNAAALKLKDYHHVINCPMDLGTVYSKCVFGEYKDLGEMIDDFELMISNAKKYNPKGHFVYSKADDVSELFFSELKQLLSTWKGETVSSWEEFKSTRLALDEVPVEKSAPISTIVGPKKTEPDNPSGCGRTVCHSLAAIEGLKAGGAKAVHLRMVGNDVWLLEKSQSVPPGVKNSAQGKKPQNSNKRKSSSSGSESAPKRRRQSWLGEEVGSSMRRMRPCFFACSLLSKSEPPREKEPSRSLGIDANSMLDDTVIKSRIADARHSLLEFSQFRNLEFDTLRRSKYSTAILLYHLQRNDAPGVVPTCCGCSTFIKDVRWHKIGRVAEESVVNRARGSLSTSGKAEFQPAELCKSCYELRADKDEFIPIQVTLR